MAEENQVQQEPQKVTTEKTQQVTTEMPQRVTMKDLKKIEVGKRLAAHSRKKRELKAQESEGVNQYYCTGAVIAVGVIGGLGYYIYGTKQPSHGPSEPGVMQRPHTQLRNPPPQSPPRPQTNKFEMD